MHRTPPPTRHDIATPLARWDDDDAVAADLVWWAQLDGRYLVEVVRTDRVLSAVLRIFDHMGDDRLVADRPVAMTGDGSFGPLLGDVVAWQRIATDIVDDPLRVDYHEGDLK